MSTEGEGTLSTFTSSPAYTSEPVGVYLVPSHLSTLVSTSSMILVLCEFVHSLVYSERITNTQLQNIETEVTMLYR